MEPMPPAEVSVTLELVQQLLRDQHPDLAALPLRMLAHGWDNVSFRLGEELVVRLPRRAVAVELIRHEQRWLPALAPLLPLPVPAPVRTGQPAPEFRWPWSIVPYLQGEPAAVAPPAGDEAAIALGGFLAALHRPAPPDAPRNPFRGVPLAVRDEALRSRLAQLRDVIDVAVVGDCWQHATTSPPWSNPPVWLHGDLHAANILVVAGRISGVIDFGDVTGGDPATDLAVGWSMFAGRARAAFRLAYRDAGGPATDDDSWARARGWALALSLALLASSRDNPLMADIGSRALTTVLAD